MAKVELRGQAVQIQPTDGFAEARSVCLNLVYAYEPPAPVAVKPLEWIFLTTLAVRSVDEVQQIAARYLLRRRTEDWLRILKSGLQDGVSDASQGRAH